MMHLWRRVSTVALAGICTLAVAACGNSDNGGDEGSISSEKTGEISASDQLDFGQTSVGGETSASIDIDNVGNGVLTLESISLNETDGDGTQEFRAVEWLEDGTTIEPGESKTLEVMYTPKDPNEDTGEIVIRSDTQNQGEKNPFTIELNPDSLAPSLTVSRSQVNFSGVAPGSRASQSIILENTGYSALNLDDIRISDSDRYTVTKFVDQSSSEESGDDKEGGSGNEGQAGPAPCSDESASEPCDPPISEVIGTSLEPGETVKIRVYFEPINDQAVEGNLVIFSNDSESSETVIPLIGNSGTPCLGLSQDDTINFGSTSTGQTATQTVTVQNCRSQADDLTLNSIQIDSDEDDVFEIADLPGNLGSGEPYTLEGDEQVNFAVQFTPAEKSTYNGQIRVQSNDPAYTRQNEKDGKLVDLVGKGNDNPCPTASAKAGIKGSGQLRSPDNQGVVDIDTLPLETIQFDGTNSSDQADGSIERYEWSIIDRPADSTARLTPSANVAKPEMFLDLAGEYTVELVVYDDDGAQSCGQRSLVKITAVPDDDIHVQLVWDTPSDPDETDTNGTDLDLHYLSPKATSWNEAPWDIFWYNKTADWGQSGDSSDDPSLDIDDTDGAGPENVNHNNPAPGNSYTVGVYYYDDNGFGPSYATVRIYVRGELAKEYKNKYMKETFDFWKVGLIDWPSGNIYKRDEMYDDFPNASTGG
jgi:hypothetical protein